MATQSEDFKWFIKNLKKLYGQYPEKYVVIHEKTIICTGETFEEALSGAMKEKLDLGSFIIQKCGQGEDCYTQSFSSRVVFA